jgi:hypothetical protein
MSLAEHRNQLRLAGFHAIREKTLRSGPRTERIEWWSGQKGVVLLQVWEEDSSAESVVSYADWAFGNTLESFINALSKEES